MTTRHIYDVTLEPILGSTFQPTTFPDLGAAVFERVDGESVTPSLLVESVQSMANRLEATAWDGGKQEPHSTVSGLGYVRVERPNGEFLTASRLEAHRLASAWIFESTHDGVKMLDVIRDRLGLAKDTPLNYPRMAAELFALDPFCLLHGVFFSRKEWIGQPKFTRAVSGVIEAHDVRRAASGGRKSELVRHNTKGEEGGGTAEGYGSVPFHRVEWTARTIRASFVIDVALLRSYGLPETHSRLLEVLAQWEIHSLLTDGLRLRTACDLGVVGDITVRRGDPLPEITTLENEVRSLISGIGAVDPLVIRRNK